MTCEFLCNEFEFPLLQNEWKTEHETEYIVTVKSKFTNFSFLDVGVRLKIA